VIATPTVSTGQEHWDCLPNRLRPEAVADDCGRVI
jgi:hypothetical protein